MRRSGYDSAPRTIVKAPALTKQTIARGAVLASEM
jgi:hypothetical protein